MSNRLQVSVLTACLLAGPNLVVVPEHLARQWCDEIQKFAPSEALRVYLVSTVEQHSKITPAVILCDLTVVVVTLQYFTNAERLSGELSEVCICSVVYGSMAAATVSDYSAVSMSYTTAVVSLQLTSTGSRLHLYCVSG